MYSTCSSAFTEVLSRRDMMQMTQNRKNFKKKLYPKQTELAMYGYPKLVARSCKD